MSNYSPLKKLLLIAAVLCETQLLTACAEHIAQPVKAIPPQISAAPQNTAYAPGLGEFMAQISTRHHKLWYAGKAKNWQLADYELEEIHEGLDDLAKYHPTHDKVKGSIPDLMATYMKAPLAQTETAIKAKNAADFRTGYDNITAGCNSCHQANDFGFNVIQRPVSNPFANQSFKNTP
ncbi:hypothetical protein [Crenothrix polyspora]|uniref:Cytochrome c domain-containing protein n=1 Tax=Crenothrix polyspora TaxID=360316 RepID=A0A1R4H7Z3_9GAMM|nr:hypothetical protein [Crenothrix polyspora]SJM92151.1 conserved exported hypothetical protein [Crenothrix polyspora]